MMPCASRWITVAVVACLAAGCYPGQSRTQPAGGGGGGHHDTVTPHAPDTNAGTGGGQDTPDDQAVRQLWNASNPNRGVRQGGHHFQSPSDLAFGKARAKAKAAAHGKAKMGAPRGGTPAGQPPAPGT